MKIVVGDRTRTFGTVEDTPRGLVLKGDHAVLSRLVENLAGDADPATLPGGLAAFVRRFAETYNTGYTWCEDATDR